MTFWALLSSVREYGKFTNMQPFIRTSKTDMGRVVVGTLRSFGPAPARGRDRQ